MQSPSEEEKTEQLDKALGTERIDLTKKISDTVKMINDISKLSEAQVLMLSYRHILVDKMITLKSGLYRRRANNENYRKIRHEYYKTKHNLRLDYREITQFINSDMSLRNRQKSLLEAQINYYQQCIETLDKMGFAIKAKISIEEFNNKIY
jgi:hypothetical protein